MSIKGVWKKFLDYMRLNVDKDYLIDLNNMITLPDGGFILKVVDLDTRDIAGIAVISKNKTPSLISTATDENLIDDENKYRLEEFLQKFCDALKA